MVLRLVTILVLMRGDHRRVVGAACPCPERSVESRVAALETQVADLQYRALPPDPNAQSFVPNTTSTRQLV